MSMLQLQMAWRRCCARRSRSIWQRSDNSSNGYSTHVPHPSIVHKRGSDILHDPWFTKETAFPMTERDRLGLRGLLPPRIIGFEQQRDRFMVSFKSLEENTRGGRPETTALAKWRILNRLHDRNETLYYKILIDHIEQFAPIIYTPTVGLVCQNYSGLFRRPRGMYFSAKDKGEMMSMIYNWPAEQVDMIVVTDGSRMLGLGDLGVQGIAIPIGKLDIYVAAAGINPRRILPVMLDVGTNNEKLLNNDLYLGLRQPRLDGEEYLAVVDEFMEAVFARWPRVIVQFEDFQTKWAFRLLQRYRRSYRMFNDDVQGTAGVALAGLFGAVRAQGRPLNDLIKQKLVVVGAGSAGIGVLNMVHQAMKRMSGSETFQGNQFWLLDKSGLITKARKDLEPDTAKFARDVSSEVEGLPEGASLVEVIKKVKPDVLLGLSGVGGIFNREVLEAMKHSGSKRPAVFAMSNPTDRAECTAYEAFKYAGDNIIFASGSPFENVDLGSGLTGYANQGNNMYLFPGIGLGTLLAGAHLVSDGMLQASAECLAEYMSDAEVQRGVIFPSISRIRDITMRVAAAVVRAAVAEENAEGYEDISAKDLRQMSEEETIEYVKRNMWSPRYTPLVQERD